MNPLTTEAADVGPLLIYFFAVLGLAAAMLLLSHFLGPRRHDRATDEPFESGVVPQGDARFHVAIPFYLVAILFVIFDLEAVFLFAWAIAFREVGWLGFIEVTIFIVILIAALLYLWRMGALDWKKVPLRRTTRTQQEERKNAI